MKKLTAFWLTCFLAAGVLSACGTGTAASPGKQEDTIHIVTTIFPEYDWVMNILGDNPAGAEVTMLLDNGVDLHSYQPSAADILEISSCDLFVYVGGESEDWVDDALKEATNTDMIVVGLLDALGDAVKEEETVEGMQEDHDHDHADHGEEQEEDHDHEEDENHDHDEEHEQEEHEHEHEEHEYDEHVWLSLRNAAVLTEKLSQAIREIDPANAALYEENAEAYVAKLLALDAAYDEAVTKAPRRTLLFGDRFPFRYLTDDYGLEYYAAFSGCSAETEASFETVTFLSKKTDELSLSCVMTIEGTDHRIAETIVNNTKTKDQRVLVLDSMQGTTAADIQNGVTYLSVMEKNLEVLQEALGAE